MTHGEKMFWIILSAYTAMAIILVVFTDTGTAIFMAISIVLFVAVLIKPSMLKRLIIEIRKSFNR